MFNFYLLYEFIVLGNFCFIKLILYDIYILNMNIIFKIGKKMYGFMSIFLILFNIIYKVDMYRDFVVRFLLEKNLFRNYYTKRR